MPRISVITGAYNQAAVIRETISSVLDQTFADFEYIVVDDGSTDETGAILDEFADRINVIHQANAGNVASRNRAVAEAKGELIAVVDGDDIWHPQKLQKQVAAFDRDPNVGLSYTSMVEIDPSGRVASGPMFTDISDDPLKWQLLSNACPFSSMLVRRDALPAGRIVDPRFNLVGDRYLTLQVALQGYAFHALADPPIMLRTHAASMRHSAEFRDNYLRQMLAVVHDVQRDNRFPRSHRRWIRHAVASSYFSSAWLAIDRGDRTDLPRAALELARCLVSSPSHLPQVARQGLKLTLRASGIWRADRSLSRAGSTADGT